MFRNNPNLETTLISGGQPLLRSNIKYILAILNCLSDVG